jgi:hypothetical protein
MTDQDLRSLDAWIAEHVCEWTNIWPNNLTGVDPKTQTCKRVPYFSTSPAAFFALLSKLIADGWCITQRYYPTKKAWAVELIHEKREGIPFAQALTLPEALTLAAKAAYSKPEAPDVQPNLD